MRIIGNIEHPHFKISVFRMDGRTTLKFENPLYEAAFKLGDDERFATLEGVRQWVEAGLGERMAPVFQLMHQARLETLQPALPPHLPDSEDEII